MHAVGIQGCTGIEFINLAAVGCTVVVYVLVYLICIYVNQSLV